MAYDVSESINRKIQKLIQWRDRYTKQEYPHKVIVNLFYELYTIHFMWEDIQNIFEGSFSTELGRTIDYPEALNQILTLKRNIQVGTVNPRLMSLIESNQVVCDDIHYKQYVDMIEGAQNGSNDDIEEIEYSYVYIATVIELVIPWAAFGLLGMNKHKAFVEVTGGDIGGFSIKTFGDAYDSFNILSNTMIGASYKKLPPLW